MEINLIINDGDITQAWHINPSDCDLIINLDGSLTIRPADSAWEQITWGLEVATDQQIDPTQEPWPDILRRVNERFAAGDRARQEATEKNAVKRR